MRLITSEPQITSSAAKTNRTRPEVVSKQRVHVARVEEPDGERAGRAAGTTRPSATSGPAAVSVRTSRRSSCRSRMVSTTRSSTSAVLPPVSRCKTRRARPARGRGSSSARDHVERILERDAELLVGDDPLGTRCAPAPARRRPPPKARRRSCARRGSPRRARRGCPAAVRANSVRLRSTLRRITPQTVNGTTKPMSRACEGEERPREATSGPPCRSGPDGDVRGLHPISASSTSSTKRAHHSRSFERPFRRADEAVVQGPADRRPVRRLGQRDELRQPLLQRCAGAASGSKSKQKASRPTAKTLTTIIVNGEPQKPSPKPLWYAWKVCAGSGGVA